MTFGKCYGLIRFSSSRDGFVDKTIGLPANCRISQIAFCTTAKWRMVSSSYFCRNTDATVELLLDDGVSETETVVWESQPIGNTQGVETIDIPVPVPVPSVVASSVIVRLETGKPLALAEVEVIGHSVNAELTCPANPTVQPTQAPTVDVNVGSFKLKLLWEEGYPWPEASWCA